MSRFGVGVTVAALMVVLSGCSDGIRQHIREKDFRAQNRVDPALAAAPSPIANVADMPGWTTDMDGALAFARENGQKTVLFAQNQGNPANTALKNNLNSADVATGLDGAQKVTFDAAGNPEVASRYGIQAPAVVVLDPSGNAIAQQGGKLNKTALLAITR